MSVFGPAAPVSVADGRARPLAGRDAIIVKLSARPDFSAISAMPRGASRKTAAWNAIVATAQQSQVPVRALADSLRASGAISGYETLTSPNAIVVSPTAGHAQEVAKAFQALAGVKALYSNENGFRYGDNGRAPITPRGTKTRGYDVVGPIKRVPKADVGAPYGQALIGAPDAWKRGADGHGLVFGSIDTGADASHPELRDAYRGRQADGTINDDYSFYRPSQSGASIRDTGSHGTHTVGTAVGAHVGIAPGAKFISAVGLEGNVDSTFRAIQWMLAPTKTDGSAADPTKAPDVLGMSWYTGRADQDLFLESMQDVRAAGIVAVKSAGNNGPMQGTITSPGQFGEVIATAAVNARGEAVSFSSRGPASFPAGTTTPKPDFAAPGDAVLSALPGGRYGEMSGTSMAQPHMSGAILDILSVYPQLTDTQLYAVLAAGAVDKGEHGRDMVYGNGLINIPASLDAAAATLGLARTA